MKKIYKQKIQYYPVYLYKFFSLYKINGNRHGSVPPHKKQSLYDIDCTLDAKSFTSLNKPILSNKHMSQNKHTFRKKAFLASRQCASFMSGHSIFLTKNLAILGKYNIINKLCYSLYFKSFLKNKAKN